MTRMKEFLGAAHLVFDMHTGSLGIVRIPTTRGKKHWIVYPKSNALVKKQFAVGLVGEVLFQDGPTSDLP